MNNTSDYLDYEKAFKTALNLIKQHNRIGLYIMFQINTGLRYSDLKKLSDKDINEAIKNDNHLKIKEQKTKKEREILLNNYVLKCYEIFPKVGYLFKTQKGTVHTAQNLNQQLKKIFADEDKINISTHSLRKTFSRKFYDEAENKEDALVMLSDILNHSDTKITRRYLGITRDEISNIYKGFEGYIESFLN